MSFPHWLGKALSGKSQVDIIFSGGNGLTRVDDEWFARAVPARVLGFNVLLNPPEELLWSKSFVMERERYDGADVLHLILARAETLDWEHVCDRFRGHEGILLSYLFLFRYVYPGEASRLPFWLIPQSPRSPGSERYARGALVPGHAPLTRAIPGGRREMGFLGRAAPAVWIDDRQGIRDLDECHRTALVAPPARADEATVESWIEALAQN